MRHSGDGANMWRARAANAAAFATPSSPKNDARVSGSGELACSAAAAAATAADDDADADEAARLVTREDGVAVVAVGV